jgi:hypothetical protein
MVTSVVELKIATMERTRHIVLRREVLGVANRGVFIVAMVAVFAFSMDLSSLVFIVLHELSYDKASRQ